MKSEQGRGDRWPKILIVGPLGSGESATNVIGGNKVSCDDLVHELEMRGFELDMVDTSGRVTNLPRWKVQASRLARFLRMVRGVVKKIRHSQLVFVFIAPSSATVVASSAWILCRIARRPLVLRLSGADLDSVYCKYGAPARWLADRTWMRCSLMYVETQRLRRIFDNRTSCRWLPNIRNVEAHAAVGREERHKKEIRKLIFISRLHMDKGLAEALRACRDLPDHCHLQVFGPRMSDTDFSLFAGHPRASYCGVLQPEEVPQVMRDHDVLLFPSYYPMEGYPGVIIEAFQCGLPVIAARWRDVPELVEHEENGLVVEPRSAAAVRSAIERLLNDPGLYRRLCEGARRRGDDFRSKNWFGPVAEDLRALTLGTGAIATGTYLSKR